MKHKNKNFTEFKDKFVNETTKETATELSYLLALFIMMYATISISFSQSNNLGLTEKLDGGGEYNNNVMETLAHDNSFLEMLTVNDANENSDNLGLRGGKKNIGKVLRIYLNGKSGSDETVFRFHPEATYDFDGNFDAYYLSSMDPKAASMCTQINGIKYAINSIPELTQDIAIAIKVTVGITGNHTITTSSLKIFQQSTCVVLEDLLTKTKTDLKTNNSYTFYIADTTKAPRFLIHFSAPLSKTVPKQIADANFGNKDGMIVAKPSGEGFWNYIWQDNNANVLQNTIAAKTDTLKNLAAGNYKLIIEQMGGCGADTIDWTVDTMKVQAVFKPSKDTVETHTPIQFINHSTGGTDFAWDFGDNTTSTLENPMHTYLSDGTFNVSLVVKNSKSERTSVTNTTIFINKSIDNLTGIGEQRTTSNEQLISIINNTNGVFIKFDFETTTDATINVFNVLGQIIIPVNKLNVSQQIVQLDLPSESPTMYLVTVATERKNETFKIIK